MTLEQGYYWSQIILMGIAAVAVAGAYIQLQTFKRFELLKILEDRQLRKARRLLFRKLYAPNTPPSLWWDNDEELEEAAADVCASFDIVGLMASQENRKFFKTHWAYTICWTHDVLEKYLESRQPSYRGYRELHNDAKPFDPRRGSRSN